MAHARWIVRGAWALLFSASAWAAGGGGSGMGSDFEAAHEQPDYRAGVAAIGDKRWADAVQALDRYVARNYRDPDGHNWLAYAHRNAGRFDEAFKQYKLALNLDPKHLGAHEYIGEAYVMTGQIAEARKHLDRLGALCGKQCEQYRDLAEAIERGKVTQAR
jgi:tetratricopeptide (TPR) repeat protein